MMLMLALLIGCGGKSETPAPSANAVVEKSAVVASAAAVEALKTADAADGVEDKVATKCSGCALSMDGDAAHTLTVDGYALHLCSAMCKEYFSKDVEGNLKKLIN